MAQITVEDILSAMDDANTSVGRLKLQNDVLQREVLDLSRRIAALTEVKEDKEQEEK